MSRSSGEASRLEQCVQANGADILRYLQRRVNSDADAADAYGETLLTAHRARHGIPEDDTHARMWLFAVARNVLSNNRRVAARRFAAVQRLREQLATQTPGPSAETSLDVRAAVEALSPELAEVVKLTYWDGFKSHEIAELLEISASTVRTRISTARALLRLALSDSVVHAAADTEGDAATS